MRGLVGPHISIMTSFKTLIYLLHGAIFIQGNSFQIDDSVLFKLSWPGSQEELDNLRAQSLLIKTSNNEEFSCKIPDIMEELVSKDEGTYKGPNPIELLHPLFLQMSCSYMLEPFWTYELCHGRFLRQFHDDGGPGGRIQEYYLGKWDSAKFKEEVTNYDSHLQEDARYVSSKKKINGQYLSTVMINMTDGSVCDINNERRQTRVYYVCNKNGKHEIYSLEEVSTCEYEVVVLSPYLCSHPNFKLKEQTVHDIQCYSINNSPTKPKALQSEEKLLGKFSTLQSNIEFGVEDGAPKSSLPTPNGQTKSPENSVFDLELVQSFLRGEYCLHGGNGWWKYEFCYGHHVIQYHEEKGKRITTLKLGSFIKSSHIDWIKRNPQKKPKPNKKASYISHFYSDGNYCDETKKPREVEVKMKCKEDFNPNAVSLYLLEPSTCEYILGVESSIICPLMDTVDEYGLSKDMSDSHTTVNIPKASKSDNF